MRSCKNYTLAQLRDYSTLFSRSEVDRYYRGDFSSLSAKILRYDSHILSKSDTYAGYLRKVYSILERYYPSEYVVKNRLIERWIRPQIGYEHSIIFNELRLGKAVADLAVFNGVSRVFEIKTMLDSENRLESQLAQYQRIFDEVYVVVPIEKSEAYLKKNLSVGLIAFDIKDRSYQELRKSSTVTGIDSDSLMQVLHTHEYVRIVEDYFGERPAMTDFTKFAVCRELIRGIPSNELSKRFVTVMKERKVYNEFCRRDAYLNQVCLAMNYTKVQRNILLNHLRTTLS